MKQLIPFAFFLVVGCNSLPETEVTKALEEVSTAVTELKVQTDEFKADVQTQIEAVAEQSNDEQKAEIAKIQEGIDDYFGKTKKVLDVAEPLVKKAAEAAASDDPAGGFQIVVQETAEQVGGKEGAIISLIGAIGFGLYGAYQRSQKKRNQSILDNITDTINEVRESSEGFNEAFKKESDKMAARTSTEAREYLRSK